MATSFSGVRKASDCVALSASQQEFTLAVMAHRSESTRKQLTAAIALNIAALDRQLNLKNPLSEDNIDFIAEQIVDEFGNTLTMADVFLVLRNALAGMYGKFYERLSAPDVLSWFRNYYNERFDIAEQYHVNRSHNEFNKADENLLRGLGYTVKDGKLTYDHDQLKRNDEYRHEVAKRIPKDKPDFDEKGYKAWKKQYLRSLSKTQPQG